MSFLSIVGVVLGVNTVIGAISSLIKKIKPDNDVSPVLDKVHDFIDIIGSNVRHKK